MKELSIEEKAFHYDEASKWMENVYPSLSHEQQMEAEAFFPELCESENEKIRRALMKFIEKFPYERLENDGVSVKDALAWLEKQGEKPKPSIRERYKRIANSEWFKKTHEGMSISDDEKVDNVNKIELKFKVGDWITNGVCTIQITSIDDRYYWHDNDCVGGDIESIDKEYHLWTIQDAKNGDVLSDGTTIFIFKDLLSDGSVMSYCDCDADNSESDAFCPSSVNLICSKITPATKEQRDLLFQKMREAGYGWDTEKKELEKIENEEVNGEDYGIDGLWHAQRILEKTLGSVDGYQSDDGILDHKAAITAVKKLYKQKPAWSQEDREYMVSLLDIINGTPSLTPSEVECHKDWLKSIKQRIGG